MSALRSSSTGEDTKEELAELRSQFEHLADTVQSMAASRSADIRAAVRDGLKSLGEHGGDAFAHARDTAERVASDTQETISRNPLTAVLIALGVGLVLGLVTRSVTRE